MGPEPRVALAASLGALFLLALPAPAAAAIFTVNSTQDLHDADTGDNLCETLVLGEQCTLRAAIEQANALDGTDEINFSSALNGTPHVLSLGQQLAITQAVTITGNGSGTAGTVIHGGADSNFNRVFTLGELGADGVTLRSLQVTGGDVRGSSSAVRGAGIEHTDGELVLDHVVVAGNIAVGQSTGGGFGGGIASSAGTNLTITDSQIGPNGIQWGGGAGIYTEGTLTVTRSTISGNDATDAFGGGLYLSGAEAKTITNSTISDNFSAQFVMTSNFGGAAIFASQAGNVTVTSTTIAQNNARGPGLEFPRGGIYAHTAPAAVTVKNTILSGNGGPTINENCTTSGGATITSATPGNNIDSGTSCNFPGASGNVSSTDPLLAPLGDYGGPTRTHALFAGSPAIDMVPVAECAGLSTDQRGTGFPRPVGPACDAGSFEGEIAPPATGGGAEPPPEDAGDTDAPETLISGPKKVKRRGTFTLTSDEAGSSFECRLDEAGSFMPCGSPYTTPKLQRGKHSLEARATDMTGNVDPSPAIHNFKRKRKNKS
jgi:CSLREA domain-containing protein